MSLDLVMPIAIELFVGPNHRHELHFSVERGIGPLALVVGGVRTVRNMAKLSSAVVSICFDSSNVSDYVSLRPGRCWQRSCIRRQFGFRESTNCIRCSKV